MRCSWIVTLIAQATIAAVCLAQDRPDIGHALALSHSQNPESRVTAIHLLAKIKDSRAGERYMQLVNDVDPTVRAEALLLALDYKAGDALYAYHNCLYEIYRKARKLSDQHPEAEKKLMSQIGLDQDITFHRRPDHFQWLVSYLKTAPTSDLTDRIIVAIIKEADIPWGSVLYTPGICGTGLPEPYDGTKDTLAIYRRNPSKCLQLALSDDKTGIHLFGTLAATGDRSSASNLIRLTKSDDRDIRALAILALTEVSPKGVAQNSQRLLQDKNHCVRGAAAIALFATDVPGQLDDIAELCVKDYWITLQVYWALYIHKRYDHWRENGLRLSTLPELTDERLLAFCRKLVFEGDLDTGHMALSLLEASQDERTVQELLKWHSAVEDDDRRLLIVASLKRLGYDPPVISRI